MLRIGLTDSGFSLSWTDFASVLDAVSLLLVVQVFGFMPCTFSEQHLPFLWRQQHKNSAILQQTKTKAVLTFRGELLAPGDCADPSASASVGPRPGTLTVTTPSPSSGPNPGSSTATTPGPLSGPTEACWESSSYCFHRSRRSWLSYLCALAFETSELSDTNAWLGGKDLGESPEK